MITLGVLQVVLRKMGASLIWADPAIRYSVLWIGFIAASVATRRGRHISVDALSRFLPAGPARVAEIVADLSAAAVTLLLFVATSCAFLPPDPGATLLAPISWVIPDSLFATWTDYLVGDEGIAFTIAVGDSFRLPVRDWVATLVVPVGFSLMSVRFAARAAMGIAGMEVEGGGEVADAADVSEAANAVEEAEDDPLDSPLDLALDQETDDQEGGG